MISKAKLKWVKSLQVKKYRQAEQCFLVQGVKGVIELLRSTFNVELIAGTSEVLKTLNLKSGKKIECYEISVKELESMSSFQSNDSVLAVARMKKQEPIVVNNNEFLLMLDDIRDPGNLGTIIRTADWFGIKQIIASPQTADFYNPKTISSTMGSFCRVVVYYVDLASFIKKYDEPVYGTFITGKNIHEERFGKSGAIVIGNESNGISADVEGLIKNRISIPGSGNAESLNAAIATGIVLDNIFRKK